MKKNLLLIAFLAGVLSGCSTTQVPDVVTHYDQTTGVRTDLIPENLLESPQDPPREMVWLNASRVYKNRDDFDYYLEVHYEAHKETGLLEILPGDSLVVTVDGEPVKFRTSGSFNSRHERNNVVSEDAIYEAGVNELKSLAYGKNVTVKIAGRNGTVVREFKPENFQRFQKFVDHYIDAKPFPVGNKS